MKDFYWLNRDAKSFLKRGYLKEGQTAEDRVREISDNAEKILGIKGFSDKFYSYMAKGYYSLATPVWTNFGNERGLPVSCFSSYVDDTMESILYKTSEVGMMSKMGGGTSGFFGALRPRGASISAGGESSGPVHFLEIYDKISEVVSQGSARRGSFAAYLPIDHPDIEDFLRIRGSGHPIQNLSIGVTITDEWMNEMLNGDKQKRSVWGKLIRKRFETGYPYISFIDNINNQNPQVYKDKDLTVKSQNLCVSGNQRVPTQFGLLTAKELFDLGEDLILFDNEKEVKSSSMKLIEKKADVYKVTLENGMSHTITDYHKVKTSVVEDFKEVEYIKECKDLQIGDRVAVQTNKGIFGKDNFEKEAFLLGLYQSDGTQHKDLIMFDLWENDFDLIDEVQANHDYICEKYKTQFSKRTNRAYPFPKFSDCYVSQSEVAKKRLASKACKKALNFEKGYVPDWIFSSDEQTQWQYLRGLLYADGTVHCSKSKGNPIQISYADINKEFLEDLQLIFANLGLQSSIRLLRKEGEALLPDGKGGSKLYSVKECWRLIIGNKNDALQIEKNTGFLSRKNVHIEDKEYRDNTKKYYKVKSIEKLEEKEDVYCVSVDSEEHLWVCNGVITHNCNEICLHTDPQHSFVCVLSSLNLLHWDEIQKTDAVETLVYFLDAVNEEFVRKSENTPFMDAAHKFAKEHRALGMGVLGWHSLLQSKMIPFESMDAKFLNSSIFKFIREKADQATEDLAKKFGEPEVLKGYGRRNTHTMAIAPTTSSSFILGQISPSIEPLNSNYFVKDLAKGKFSYRNPYLLKILEERGKNNESVWKTILTKGGSVQHLNFLTDQEKEVFKTFGEISQKEIVIQASQRQQFIDQGQSLNVMVHPDVKPKEVSQLLIEGWKLGIKGFYYQRSANPAQELSRKLLECKSCEG